MVDKTTRDKNLKTPEKRARWAMPSRWVLLGVLCVGLCFSLVAFFLLNTYVARYTKGFLDDISVKMASEIGVEFSALDHELHQGVEMLRLVSDVPTIKSNDDVITKLQNLNRESFKNYDEVIWLRQGKSGAAWAVYSYYVRDLENGNSPHAMLVHKINDPEFVEFILAQDVLNASGAQVLNFDFAAEDETGIGQAFVLAESFRSNDGAANNVLLVRVNMDRLVWRSLTGFSGQFSALSILNLDNGQVLLDRITLDDGVVGRASLGGVPYRYDLLFGGKSWEVRFDVLKSSVPSDVSRLPLLVLGASLVFVMLAVGALVVVLRRLQRSNALNSALKTKSFTLKNKVAKRTKLYKALKRSEAENRATIDAVSDIIFEVDVQGNLIFLNSAWRKVTGFDIDQSSGNNLFSMLHPNDQEKQEEDFKLLTRGQKNAYRGFTRIRTADGTFRAVELAVSMIRQDVNQNLRVVGTLTDVEERRRAERALSEAEKKYRTIVENAAGGIFQLTPEGLYLNVNQAFARILGYESPEQVLRQVKNANEAIYADIKSRMRFIRDLEKAGVVNSYEVEVTRKDGKRIWVNENVRVVRDDNGNVMYYEGSLEDITPRKESEIFLNEAKVKSDLANRAKSEFLANMSHELRTPLNAIIGFSEIIKNQIFGPLENEEYLNYAGDIYESGKGLLKVINEILDISKIEAGDRQLDDSVVDVSKAVQNALDMLAGKIMDSEMSIANTLENVPEIVGEELALKQVILNLLSNAVKFTPHGGRVTISHQVDQSGRFRLSFTDTGIGLDEAEIEKALSPFGQVDNSLSRSGSGTGLGLTLVDALLKMHGGELELFSQKGTGTTATIILPAERVRVKSVKADDTEQV